MIYLFFNFIAFNTVSYTHLDVYKRQGEECGDNHGQKRIQPADQTAIIAHTEIEKDLLIQAQNVGGLVGTSPCKRVQNGEGTI